ncbi:MAG TPA: hypothetical protein VIK31_07425 [Propionibacteriaceae bacterium]
MTDQVTVAEDHLGDADAHRDISVLQPYRPAVGAYPVSARTGEPTRPALLGVSVGLLVAGAVISSVGLVKVLWDAATVTGYHTAARVLQWTKPDPVSFLTIVMVLTIGAIGALVATAAAAIAYNAWNGRRWTRIGGIVALAISALTILLNPFAMVAMAPIAIGAGLLWLPQVGRYFSAWGTIRTPPTVRRGWAENVVYGILPRYRRDAS